jgi:hypothetical protein
MFFKKKEKIEFYSSNANALYSHPIEPASRIKFNWLEHMKVFFKNKEEKHINTLRCPGIFTPFKHGFILSTWYDFKITTSTSPLPDKSYTNIEFPNTDIFLGNQEVIQYHDPVNLVDFYNNHIIESRPCHKNIVKITTSWNVKLPSGWSLLQTNIPYTDETRFSTCTGIFDSNINNQITVPLFWHVLNGTELVKAGTPLCFLLPIKLSDKDYEVREATPREQVWDQFHKYKRNNTFIKDYKSMARVAQKYFSKK